MARAEAIEVEGRVVEAVSHGVYRVELANGHRLLAHFGRRKSIATAVVGGIVRLELSPFDLSTGRILSNETEI